MARKTPTAKWQLHESTQRGLCRIAFLFLGVLPLICALVFSIAQFVPAYQRSKASGWSDWLSARLGVDVEIAAVESLAPDRFNLHGVRIAHPESRALLGRIRAVEVSRAAGLWSVQLVGPELEGMQLSSTWKMVHDWFMCRPNNDSHAVRLTSQGLQLRNVAHEQALSDIAIEVHPQSERTLISIQFRLPGDKPDSKPTLIRISRFHHERHLATNLRLEAGTTPLPCSLISPLFPQLKTFGEQSAIAGNFSVQQKHGDWEVNLENAYLLGIDFGQLTTGLQRRIAGSGWVWCKQATVTDRGLQHLVGVVGIERGRIDYRWLAAGQRFLGVALPREIQLAQVPLHSFEQLRFNFEISAQQLRFTGLAQNAAEGAKRVQPGTLIADAAGALAIKVSDEPVPLQNLVGFLNDAPDVTTASAQLATGLIPAGWLAQKAAHWLPLGASSQSPPPSMVDEDREVRLSRAPQ